MGLLDDDQFNALWEAAQPGDQTGHRVKRLERKPSRAEIGGAFELVDTLPSPGVPGRALYLSPTDPKQKGVYLDHETQWVGPLVAVGAKYGTSNQDQPFSTGLETVVDFDAKAFDTHDAVRRISGGWEFVVPVAGFYWIDAHLVWSSTTSWVIGNISQLRAFVNGVAVALLAFDQAINAGTTSIRVGSGGSTVAYCQTGDIIDIRALQTGLATRFVAGTPTPIETVNYVNIMRMVG